MFKVIDVKMQRESRTRFVVQLKGVLCYISFKIRGNFSYFFNYAETKRLV